MDENESEKKRRMKERKEERGRREEKERREERERRETSEEASTSREKRDDKDNEKGEYLDREKVYGENKPNNTVLIENEYFFS